MFSSITTVYSIEYSLYFNDEVIFARTLQWLLHVHV